jgi:hypothetical protein
MKCRRIYFFISIFLILSAASCAVTPKYFEPLSETGIHLEEGASVYLLANVKEAKPLLEALPINELQNKQTKMIIDKTEFLGAAFFPDRFQISTLGKYPVSTAKFAFTTSPQWKKQKSEGGDYWYSNPQKMSISLNQKQVFASSWINEPKNPITRSVTVDFPKGFNETRGCVSLWLTNSAAMIKKQFDEMALPLNAPVEMLIVNLYPAGNKYYECMINMQFPTNSHAKGFFSLLNLARNYIAVPNSLFTAILFSSSPALDGRNIIVRTDALTTNETAALVKMFLAPR